MKKKLEEIIESKEIVDIYLDIENNGNCILTYKAFNVIGLDIENNLFFGYTYEDRCKKESNRVLTEEQISLVCNIKKY